MVSCTIKIPAEGRKLLFFHLKIFYRQSFANGHAARRNQTICCGEELLGIARCCKLFLFFVLAFSNQPKSNAANRRDEFLTKWSIKGTILLYENLKEEVCGKAMENYDFEFREMSGKVGLFGSPGVSDSV